jgi:chromosomal replication initiation ATPase DnaA
MTSVDIIEELAARGLLGLTRTIAIAHDVTMIELVGRRRTQALSAARQELWAELYARGHWSYPRLGELFDRDHTTIMAGVASYERRLVIKATAAESSGDKKQGVAS